MPSRHAFQQILLPSLLATYLIKVNGRPFCCDPAVNNKGSASHIPVLEFHSLRVHPIKSRSLAELKFYSTFWMTDMWPVRNAQSRMTSLLNYMQTFASFTLHRGRWHHLKVTKWNYSRQYEFVTWQCASDGMQLDLCVVS